MIAGKTLLSKAKLLDDPHLKASTLKTLNELIEILDKRVQTVQKRSVSNRDCELRNRSDGKGGGSQIAPEPLFLVD